MKKEKEKDMGICYDTPDRVLQEKVGCDLPEHVVMEVFSRLPVKSLMRFRCISKFWCSLTNDSNFITKHLKHQKADKKRNGRLLVHSYDLASNKYIFSLCPDETIALPYYRYPDLELNIPIKNVLGPCNGIFCLESYIGTIALWNPATRQFRTLPRLPPPFPKPRASDPWCTGLGCGMDPKTNDYKVIVVMYFFGEQRKHVGVFSLSRGTWRVLYGNCGPVCAVNYSKFYTYANGFYYWYASDKDREFILSFDMINEVFQAIPDPAGGIPAESVKNVSKERFAFYENSVARILYDREEEEERCYSIWVRKGGRCWMKEVAFGPVLGGKSPLGFWKDGGLLLKRLTTSVTEELVNTRELVVLDPVTGEIKNVGIQNPIIVSVYYESLVSLGGGGNYSTGEDLRDFCMDRH